MRRPLHTLLRPLGRSTFRRQLSVVVGAGVLLLGALTAWISSWQAGLQARETLQQQGLTLAASLAQQSRLALLTQSMDNAQAPLQQAFYNPETLLVELLPAQGGVLAARGQPVSLAASQPQVQASGPYLDAESEQAWRFVAPVHSAPAEDSPFEAERPREELLGWVRVTQSKQPLRRLTQRLAWVNFGVGLACAALLMLVLRRLTRNLTQPLGELAGVMALVGTVQGPTPRARLRGPRDIVRMAQVFNRMLDQLEQREQELQQKNEELARHAALLEERVAERTRSLTLANAELQQTLHRLEHAREQLVEADKLASLGSLVAGVAHELNTPLGNALMAATTLEEEQRRLRARVGEGGLRKSELNDAMAQGAELAEMVHRNVQRAAEIIGGFKQLAIDQTTTGRRRFLAHEVLSEVLLTLAPMFRPTPFRIESELEPGLALDSYPGPLGQVITNIAQNALLHGFEGRAQGRFLVQCHAWGEEQVQIVCSDDGQGMEEAVRARIFEAFFTTKFGQGGSGLGMQIVHTLVHGLLGGRVGVESQPGGGTRVTIILPRRAPERSNAS